MKYRTYKNMLKATQMIFDKGYDWETANMLAMNCFDAMEANRANGMGVEWYIEKILTAEQYTI